MQSLGSITEYLDFPESHDAAAHTIAALESNFVSAMRAGRIKAIK
jgi:hypothetical protein